MDLEEEEETDLVPNKEVGLSQKDIVVDGEDMKQEMPVGAPRESRLPSPRLSLKSFLAVSQTLSCPQIKSPRAISRLSVVEIEFESLSSSPLTFASFLRPRIERMSSLLVLPPNLRWSWR